MQGRQNIVDDTLTPLSLVLLSFIGFGMVYGLNVFIAKNVTAEIYGDYGLAIRSLVLITTLILMGTPGAMVVHLSKFFRQKRHQDVLSYIRWNQHLILKSLSMAALVSIILLLIIYTLGYAKDQSLDNYHMAIFMIGVTPASAFFHIYISVLFAHRDYYSAKLQKSIGILGIQFTLIAAFAVSFKSLTTAHLTLVILISYALMALITFFITHYKLDGKVSLKKIEQAPRSIHEKEWLRTALYFFSNKTGDKLLGIIDLLLVEAFGNNPHITGYYTAILTIIGFMLIISKGINEYLGPLLTQLNEDMHDDDIKSIQKKLNRTNYYLIGITLTTFVVISLSMKTMLSHFGFQYQEHAQAAIVLLIGAAAVVIFSIQKTVMEATGKDKDMLKTNLLHIILIIILGPFAVIFYQLIGITTLMAVLAIIFALIKLEMAHRAFPKIKTFIFY